MTTSSGVEAPFLAWTGPLGAPVCCGSVGRGRSGTGLFSVSRERPQGVTCSMGYDQSGAGLDLRDLLGIGTFNLACLLLGMGLGWWGDAATGLTPVLTLLGLAVGVGAGVVGSWLRLRPLFRGGVGDVAGDRDGTDHG